jgi:CPA1 family monovalent cation:H+ antiporter
VRSGHARALREHGDGRQIALATFGPGDIFGELAMFDDERRSATIETIDAVEALAILGPDMRRLMMSRPALAVSLAAALAIPLATDAGAAFPERDLIIFLTFCVILGTLVLQGLSLPALIRMLRIEPDHAEEAEDAKARIHAADAAIARLDELLQEEWVREETAERLRGLYGFRRDRFASRFDGDSDGAIETQSQNYQRLRRELLDAERDAVVALGRQGVISGDVVTRVTRDLDLEDARLDV